MKKIARMAFFRAVTTTRGLFLLCIAKDKMHIHLLPSYHVWGIISPIKYSFFVKKKIKL